MTMLLSKSFMQVLGILVVTSHRVQVKTNNTINSSHNHLKRINSTKLSYSISFWQKVVQEATDMFNEQAASKVIFGFQVSVKNHGKNISCYPWL